MKLTVKAFVAAAVLAALIPTIVSAAVVTSKKTCAQAVTDAREALGNASVSEKIKAEVEDMIRISDHLCTQANFVYADSLLAIARGMTAEE